VRDIVSHVIGSMDEAVTLEVDTVTRLGDDVKIVATPRRTDPQAGDR